MAQFSMEFMRLTGSVLRGNQQRHQVAEPHKRFESAPEKPSSKPAIEVEEILSKYEVPPNSKDGYRNFFLAGKDMLLKAKCSFEEVERHLSMNIHRFGTPENRDVDGVMTSLRKYFSTQIAFRDAA